MIALLSVAHCQANSISEHDGGIALRSARSGKKGARGLGRGSC